MSHSAKSIVFIFAFFIHVVFFANFAYFVGKLAVPEYFSPIAIFCIIFTSSLSYHFLYKAIFSDCEHEYEDDEPNEAETAIVDKSPVSK